MNTNNQFLQTTNQTKIDKNTIAFWYNYEDDSNKQLTHGGRIRSCGTPEHLLPYLLQQDNRRELFMGLPSMNIIYFQYIPTIITHFLFSLFSVFFSVSLIQLTSTCNMCVIVGGGGGKCVIIHYDNIMISCTTKASNNCGNECSCDYSHTNNNTVIFNILLL